MLCVWSPELIHLLYGSLYSFISNSHFPTSTSILLLFPSSVFVSCSSFDRHVGCFHIFVLVCNVAVTRESKCIFGTLFLFILDIYKEVRLLGHMVVIFLTLCGRAPYYLLQFLHRCTFLQTIHKCSLFSTSFPAFDISGLFDDIHSNNVVLICIF